MDFVDEEDRLLLFLELGEYPLHALLEVASEACPGDDRPHVEGIDLHVPELFRGPALGDELGEALGDRRLPHARLADVDRVVLEAAAENLDRPFEDLLPTDERIHLAGLRTGGQFRREGPQKLVLLLLVLPDGFPPRVPGLVRCPPVLPARTDMPWEI